MTDLSWLLSAALLLVGLLLVALLIRGWFWWLDRRSPRAPAVSIEPLGEVFGSHRVSVEGYVLLSERTDPAVNDELLANYRRQLVNRLADELMSRGFVTTDHSHVNLKLNRDLREVRLRLSVDVGRPPIRA